VLELRAADLLRRGILKNFVAEIDLPGPVFRSAIEGRPHVRRHEETISRKKFACSTKHD
jgi:hypothetical protein